MMTQKLEKKPVARQQERSHMETETTTTTFIVDDDYYCNVGEEEAGKTSTWFSQDSNYYML